MLFRLTLCTSLVAALFLYGACTTEQHEPDTIETEEAEVYIDPDPEVQMLREAFPDDFYYSEHILFSKNTLRANGIGPFVSIERVPDEEISDADKRIGVAFLLDITDDTGECFRVGFSRGGVARFIDHIDHVIIWLNPPPTQ